jgi:polysaccharide export outer membrane protein
VAQPTLAEDYKLRPGDTVEIAFGGAPELRQKSVIQASGLVSLPVIGLLDTTGATLPSLLERVVKIAESKTYPQRTVDGHEVLHSITPDEVTLTIAEYRPVYVGGDVSKPGEQVFRPGLRVRQAVNVAGGLDVVRFRMNNPLTESADLRSTYENLWINIAQSEAKVWRLRGELGEDTGAGLAALNMPIPNQLKDNLVAREAALKKARSEDYTKEKQFLEDNLRRADAQIAIIRDKKQKDDEGSKADAAEYEKIREMVARGIAISQRMTDTRRALLFSSNQLLQDIVEETNIGRQRSEYERQLVRIENIRRQEIIRELIDEKVKLEQLRSNLRSTGEKLLYTSVVQSQLVRGTGGRPRVRIFRDSLQGKEVPGAGEDSLLEPGDSVEIHLDVSRALPGTPAQTTN